MRPDLSLLNVLQVPSPASSSEAGRPAVNACLHACTCTRTCRPTRTQSPEATLLQERFDLGILTSCLPRTLQRVLPDLQAAAQNPRLFSCRQLHFSRPDTLPAPEAVQRLTGGACRPHCFRPAVHKCSLKSLGCCRQGLVQTEEPGSLVHRGLPEPRLGDR